ncbi:MAG: hypothetical protein R3Y63_12835 [Eubacteriales bacterium]
MKLTINRICYWIFMVSGLLVMYGGYQRAYHDGDWGIFEGLQPHALALPLPVKIGILALFTAIYLPIVYRAFQYGKNKNS